MKTNFGHEQQEHIGNNPQTTDKGFELSPSSRSVFLGVVRHIDCSIHRDVALTSTIKLK